MFIDDSKKRHHDLEVKEYWAGAFDPKQPDTARHFAMLETALPMAIDMESVLTIGDHRGRDAAFFKQKINCKVTASDLNATTLEKVKIEGWVDEVTSVDVEKIPFADNSFDYVVVKEGFHHFPRPLLGLYEMLRVAKRGIILIEPNDSTNAENKSYIGINDYQDGYEEVGNYVYRISLRECLKAAWSLYLPCVIAKGFNDPYKPNQTFEEWQKEKKHLDDMIDDDSRPPNLITIGIYKELNPEALNQIPKNYKIYLRPANPYNN
jgi:SAM-dependent methyltransferase